MMAAIDTVCNSTFRARIAISAARMVSGTMAPTIRPVRQPRNNITTAITITTVSPITWCILLISRATTSGWNVTMCSWKPTGSCALARSRPTRKDLPKSSILRPAAIDTAITTAGLPW